MAQRGPRVRVGKGQTTRVQRVKMKSKGGRRAGAEEKVGLDARAGSPAGGAQLRDVRWRPWLAGALSALNLQAPEARLLAQPP